MHKKYIKKKGKKFGPYFYTTIRDKDGIARSYYLSQDKEVALKKEAELKEKMTREARGSSFPAVPQWAYVAVVLVVAMFALSMGASFTGMLGDGLPALGCSSQSTPSADRRSPGAPRLIPTRSTTSPL